MHTEIHSLSEHGIQIASPGSRLRITSDLPTLFISSNLTGIFQGTGAFFAGEVCLIIRPRLQHWRVQFLHLFLSAIFQAAQLVCFLKNEQRHREECMPRFVRTWVWIGLVLTLIGHALGQGGATGAITGMHVRSGEDCAAGMFHRHSQPGYWRADPHTIGRHAASDTAFVALGFLK